MAKQGEIRKSKFRVVAFGDLNDSDIEVSVAATSPQNAKEEAAKKEPGIGKRRDVRVYKRNTSWTRVA